MNTEKISATLYTLLGIFSGFVSDYSTFSVLSFLAPLVIFVASMYLIVAKLKPNKRKKFIAENFLTFILFWAVVWILLFNRG